MGHVAQGSPHRQEVPDSACPQMESRRITHISAEQKRRFNIKLGFDTLHSLVSTLSAQPSIKVSTSGWTSPGHVGMWYITQGRCVPGLPPCRVLLPCTLACGAGGCEPTPGPWRPVWCSRARVGHHTSHCQPRYVKRQVPRPRPCPPWGLPLPFHPGGPTGQQGHHLAEDSRVHLQAAARASGPAGRGTAAAGADRGAQRLHQVRGMWPGEAGRSHCLQRGGQAGQTAALGRQQYTAGLLSTSQDLDLALSPLKPCFGSCGGGHCLRGSAAWDQSVGPCPTAALGEARCPPSPAESWGPDRPSPHGLAPAASSLLNTDPQRCLCPTACARSSCQPRECPSHASASTRCAACLMSMSAPPRCRTGNSGSYPLGPAPAACSDPSTKQWVHWVLWLTCSSPVCEVPPAREALGTAGRCFPPKGTWWEHAKMLWLVRYKDANEVGVNGQSSGRSHQWS